MRRNQQAIVRILSSMGGLIRHNAYIQAYLNHLNKPHMAQRIQAAYQKAGIVPATQPVAVCFSASLEEKSPHEYHDPIVQALMDPASYRLYLAQKAADAAKQDTDRESSTEQSARP